MILKAQPPNTHPAIQMRKYYADVYTGNSIVAFESTNLDSILMIASQLVVKAQVISLYSYVDNPYKNKDVYGISQKALEKAPIGLGASSRFAMLPKFGKKDRQSFYNHRTPGQYYSYQPGGITGCYRYRRPRVD